MDITQSNYLIIHIFCIDVRDANIAFFVWCFYERQTALLYQNYIFRKIQFFSCFDKVVLVNLWVISSHLIPERYWISCGNRNNFLIVGDFNFEISES